LLELKAPQKRFPDAALRYAGYGTLTTGKGLEWRRDPGTRYGFG
jgi:hypothetical protein